MTKTLFLTLLTAFFLVGGVTTQAYAKCCASAEKVPCEKSMKVDKKCKCKKSGMKPCAKKMGQKKPCSKHLKSGYSTNIRTGDDVRSDIGSLKMRSGIQRNSYND